MLYVKSNVSILILGILSNVTCFNVNCFMAVTFAMYPRACPCTSCDIIVTSCSHFLCRLFTTPHVLSSVALPVLISHHMLVFFVTLGSALIVSIVHVYQSHMLHTYITGSILNCVSHCSLKHATHPGQGDPSLFHIYVHRCLQWPVMYIEFLSPHVFRCVMSFTYDLLCYLRIIQFMSYLLPYLLSLGSTLLPFRT